MAASLATLPLLCRYSVVTLSPLLLQVAAQEARKASRGWVGASLREWRDQRPLKASARVLPPDVACVALAVVLGILTWNLLHGVWVAANVYSSPSSEPGGGDPRVQPAVAGVASG